MIFSLKKIKRIVSYGCLVFSSQLAFAGDEFENSYQPNQREICEMYASDNTIDQYVECKTVKLFDPLITSKISDKVTRLSLSIEKFPDWSFPDVYFDNKKTAQGQAHPVFYIEGQGLYELSEAVSQTYTIEAASIGSIGDVIILELLENLGGTHSFRRQMIFTPHTCKEYEGYGDNTQYNLNQVFGWSPVFANEIYEKTFFSTALCN